MELIVISKPDFFKGEALLINQLFESGMQRFHLRKEGSERRGYEQLLGNIKPEYLERVALHQFHEMAPDFGIQRLHFPEAKRKTGAHLPFSQSKHFTLSTSIHQIEQLTELENFKYTFYGPVFQSISKKDYPGIVDSDFRFPPVPGLKVIALGGIDLEKTALLKKMNFDGIAILGCLWNEPEQALKTFKKILEKCQHKDLT